MQTDKTILIHSPGTVANLVCGFDILGLCLDDPCDEMQMRIIPGKNINIISEDGFNLPSDPMLNTAGAPLVEILNEMDADFGFEMRIKKMIKPGSGLGSSAASAAGAVAGANYLLGNIFSKKRQVQYAMAGEKVATGVKHADNVAPCIYGGITLIRSIFPLDIVSIPSPRLWVTVVHPQIEIRTQDARQILRKEVLLKDAIKQWGNVAGLVAGLMQNDLDLVGRSLEDVIIEPTRSILIPGFDLVKKQSKAAGALGGGISGSGPSVFMLSDNAQTAQHVATEMKQVYWNMGIQHNIYITTINETGIKIQE